MANSAAIVPSSHMRGVLGELGRASGAGGMRDAAVVPHMRVTFPFAVTVALGIKVHVGGSVSIRLHRVGKCDRCGARSECEHQCGLAGTPGS